MKIKRATKMIATIMMSPVVDLAAVD